MQWDLDMQKHMAAGFLLSVPMQQSHGEIYTPINFNYSLLVHHTGWFNLKPQRSWDMCN